MKAVKLAASSCCFFLSCFHPFKWEIVVVFICFIYLITTVNQYLHIVAQYLLFIQPFHLGKMPLNMLNKETLPIWLMVLLICISLPSHQIYGSDQILSPPCYSVLEIHRLSLMLCIFEMPLFLSILAYCFCQNNFWKKYLFKAREASIACLQGKQRVKRQKDRKTCPIITEQNH